jgi:hypothetical protein
MELNQHEQAGYLDRVLSKKNLLRSLRSMQMLDFWKRFMAFVPQRDQVSE